MTRLIDADALKKAFEDCTGECACCIHNTNDFNYCGLIDDAPTVEEGTQGEWVWRSTSQWCSECNALKPRKYPHSNYCPNCGADMRGAK